MSSVIPVGPTPTKLVCPSCRETVVTSISYETSTKTHIMALILFLCLCWPCVCVPYCMDSCKNTNHYCPKCNTFVGTYQS